MTYPQQPQQPGEPQQPGYGHPSQPTQPYGQPPYPPHQGYPPPPPKKRDRGKVIGFGCLGVVAVIVAISVISAALGGGGTYDDGKPAAADTSSTAPATPEKADEPKTEKAEAPADDKPREEPKKDKPKPEPKPESKPKAVFKVWGDAPAGVDITYGTDSDSRSGTWSGSFETTLPIDEDALYFHVFAQLMGGGDINCSVSVDGSTADGHASGDYNICNAQLNSDFFGGWS